MDTEWIIEAHMLSSDTWETVFTLGSKDVMSPTTLEYCIEKWSQAFSRLPGYRIRNVRNGKIVPVELL